MSARTTADSAEVAERLASRAVETRLAACVQVSEVKSFYHWEGGIQQDPEFLLTLKTTAEAVPELKRFIEKEHPYDEPEFIVVPVIDGSQGYLSWVARSTG